MRIRRWPRRESFSALLDFSTPFLVLHVGSPRQRRQARICQPSRGCEIGRQDFLVEGAELFVRVRLARDQGLGHRQFALGGGKGGGGGGRSIRGASRLRAERTDDERVDRDIHREDRHQCHHQRPMLSDDALSRGLIGHIGRGPGPAIHSLKTVCGWRASRLHLAGGGLHVFAFERGHELSGVGDPLVARQHVREGAGRLRAFP